MSRTRGIHNPKFIAVLTKGNKKFHSFFWAIDLLIQYENDVNDNYIVRRKECTNNMVLTYTQYIDSSLPGCLLVPRSISMSVWIVIIYLRRL